MFDRIFSAVLAFVVLAAGTLAVGTEMLGFNERAPSGPVAAVIELPAVQVTGQRIHEVAQQEETDPAQRPAQ